MHGATAYLNGLRVGHHDPTGPYQVILPADVLKPGKNEIVLKIAGGAGVRKSASGHFLFPVGQIWGPSRPAMPAVDQDIWIDFADRAYMKWVLAIPDLDAGKVSLRVTPNGLEPLDNQCDARYGRLDGSAVESSFGDHVGTDDMSDRLAYAQIGMERTEVMRRARLDAILPYMYAKWSRVRRGESRG